ncbi:DNA cytosine methyltransferase [Tenacibaculum finnmarkense]|nr:DNA (cytosine-5-)-methyltransferase [Tenacibaculum finnmarkense]MCG8723948.1 DNA (cytosine-5-)-methyltransferase [Tenacibaculum finnmarkense]MCG8765674.1 DNA (cytosine-5-)-methyltransferase [Tenacibaculum finnmarkense]MCG8778595.1 DNA (cytosine-5-)-methyltransferase [Tenacibaculum finnmarkense]
MELLNEFEVSNLLNVPLHRLKTWAKNGKLIPEEINGVKKYNKENLLKFDIVNEVFNSKWNDFIKIKPKKEYTSIELFAGAGGMALGMEKAGIEHVLLNEFEKNACNTLRFNRPKWNVLENDIQNVDFSEYKNKVDIVTGGFPCQAFSSAGKKRGFEDTRGTLFFDFARCINEVKPKVFIGENVKGLFSHDNGKTLEVIKQSIKDIGYTLIEPRVLKAMYYKVPQKRERLILVGIRNDLAQYATRFKFPEKYHRVLTVADAFKKGELFSKNVPKSEGVSYPKRKKEIMEEVPEGGYWRDLSDELQREYMGGSYFLGGGKTGLARRLSMKTPSLTIVCSPAMKQTERCHPKETRPLTIRESARIQTFPDDWSFQGAKGQQYKQIGNAVPVNLAYALGLSLVDLLNKIEEKTLSNTIQN